MRAAAFPLASLFVAGCTAVPDLLSPPASRVTAAPAPLLAQPIAIPDAKLPNPNGYDLLARAAKSIQGDGKSSPANLRNLSPQQMERQRAFIGQNAAPLAMIRQALKLPIATPPKRGLRGAIPTYSGPRGLARLVVEESGVRAADRQWDRAVGGGLDVVQMGIALQNGGNTMAVLSNSAIEILGRGEVAKWRGQLSQAQTAQAARRLEAIEAKRPPYAAIAQQEMWSSLSMLRDTLQSSDWKKMRDGSDPKGYSSMFKDTRDQARLRETSDQQIEANLVAALQATVARARLPYSPGLPIVPEPADPLSALIAGSETSRGVTTVRVIHERNRASNHLLATDLALQAFAKPSGKYPQSLSELVPKYLRAVPRDPFAPASPLRYKRQGDTFLLYSVGPDGKDNGGAPMKTRGISIDNVGDMLLASSM